MTRPMFVCKCSAKFTKRMHLREHIGICNPHWPRVSPEDDHAERVSFNIMTTEQLTRWLYWEKTGLDEVETDKARESRLYWIKEITTELQRRGEQP
jgi:hypothetical protein